MIEVLNRQTRHPVSRRRFARLLEGLLRLHRKRGADVVLVFVGSRAIHALNNAYRGKDKPTDVLSFPIREKEPDGRLYLGDIVISVERAAAQARRLGHGLERELGILTVHGFLHLAGFNHGRGHEREEARAVRRLLGPGAAGGR